MMGQNKLEHLAFGHRKGFKARHMRSGLGSTTFSLRTLSIGTFSKTTFSIMVSFVTLNINDTH